jgi:hypothetical protein
MWSKPCLKRAGWKQGEVVLFLGALATPADVGITNSQNIGENYNEGWRKVTLW